MLCCVDSIRVVVAGLVPIFFLWALIILLGYSLILPAISDSLICSAVLNSSILFLLYEVLSLVDSRGVRSRAQMQLFEMSSKSLNRSKSKIQTTESLERGGGWRRCVMSGEERIEEVGVIKVCVLKEEGRGGEGGEVWGIEDWRIYLLEYGFPTDCFAGFDLVSIKFDFSYMDFSKGVLTTLDTFGLSLMIRSIRSWRLLRLRVTFCRYVSFDFLKYGIL
ncbi:hypothetical protein Tco_0184647 [Tanacetum coccineum]